MVDVARNFDSSDHKKLAFRDSRSGKRVETCGLDDVSLQKIKTLGAKLRQSGAKPSSTQVQFLKRLQSAVKPG